MFDRRFLVTLIIPLVIEQLLAVSIGMADTVMVARVGEAAVSAISLVDAITVLIVTLFAAFATGGAVVASQYLGRKDRASANTAAGQLLLLSLSVSTALLIICMPIRARIISLVFGGIEGEVLALGSTYFLYILASLPFLASYNACAALFRSMGNSRVSLYVSVTMNVLNIAGNAYFIYAMHLGVAGAGLSTLLSRIIGAVIMLTLITRETNVISIRSRHTLKWHGEMIKRILRIGVPNAIEGSVFQIGKLMVQGFITVFGTAAIAANAISSSVVSFTNIPGGAIGLASITIIGQAVGARRHDEALYWGKRLLLISYITMTSLCIPGFFLTPTVVGFFNLSSEANTIAVTVIRTAMIMGALLWSPSFALPNFLRAAGDAKYTMAVSMLSMWFFRVAVSYYLAIGLRWGVYGVWIGMYIDWICRGLLFTQRFLRGKWRTKTLI